MFQAALRVILAGLACHFVYGQAVDQSLTFEAASVKPATPPTPNGRGFVMFRGPSGGPGTKDPGRIDYPYMSMKDLLTTAYDVKRFQIVGPAWLDSERFDINATMPPSTTKEQFRVMLQNLLTERFKITLHRETKELPTYTLGVNKGGPKLKESALTPPAANADTPPPPPLPSQPKIGPDGFPVLPASTGGRAGLFMIMMPGRARLIGQQQTMRDLADRLTNQLDRPVVDATGLTAKYDFTLTFSSEGLSGPMGRVGPMPPPPPGGGNENVFVPEGEAPPNLFGAVQSQLGLKLDSGKNKVETIVIDRIEKTPTEN